VARAEAYDRWIEIKQQETAERSAEEDAQEWAQRKRDLRERKFRHAEMVLERGEKMSQFPLAEVTRTVTVDESGRAVQSQTIKPAKWTARDAVNHLLVGYSLADEAIRDEGGTAAEEIDNYDDLVPFQPRGKTTPEQE
jgi:hypothetical protein